MLKDRLRFVTTLAVLLVCGFLTTSVVSYFVVRDTISTSITEHALPLTSDNVYTVIQRDLLRSVLISSMMAHDTFVQSWISQGENDPEEMQRYLRQIQNKYQTITSFFVSERTRHYYHPNGILEKVDVADPVDAWYFRVRDMKQPYEINIDTDTADQERISVFINYRIENEQKKYLGAIGVGIAIEAVRQRIQAYQQRFDRVIYFVDKEGKVTLSANPSEGVDNIYNHEGLAPHVKELLSRPQSTLTYQDKEGDKVFLNARFVPDLNWYLMVEAHSSILGNHVLQAFFINVLIALLITGVVFYLLYWLIGGYQKRLEQMATTDKLTGAANRHVFDALFQQVAQTAARNGSDVSLIIIDLDRFKSINDYFGHYAGDLVLQAVTKVLQSQTRASDILCRWGGDEFLLLLPGANLANTEVRAEAIRRAVEELVVPFQGDRIRLTASLGVAQWQLSESLESLLHRADQNMYGVKRTGYDLAEA